VATAPDAPGSGACAARAKEAPATRASETAMIDCFMDFLE
jgi:hypothetical protein